MNLSLNYCWLGSLLINHFLAGLVRFFPVSTEFIMIKLVTKQSISLKISRENVVTKEQFAFATLFFSFKYFYKAVSMSSNFKGTNRHHEEDVKFEFCL